MNQQERKIFRLEKELIRKHFGELKPRPIKLVRDVDYLGMACDPYLWLNESVLGESREQMEGLLKHELIHFELGDSGKDYEGHGRAFLRRAKQLGIVGLYELERCLSLEEDGARPTTRRVVPIPMIEFRARIAKSIDSLPTLCKKLGEEHRGSASALINELRGSWKSYLAAASQGQKGRTSRDLHGREMNRVIASLLALAEKAPARRKESYFRQARTLEVDLTVYTNAIKNGETTVHEEIWRRRPGRKGKSLLELMKLHRDVSEQIAGIQREHGPFPRDPRIAKEFHRLLNLQATLWTKLEDDYG